MADNPAVPSASLLHRLTDHQWLALDVVLALGLAVSLAFILDHDLASRQVRGATTAVLCSLAAAASSLPLALRRRHPTAVLASGTVGASVLIGFGAVAATQLSAALAVAIAVGCASYTAATAPHTRWRWSTIAASVGALLSSSAGSSSPHTLGPAGAAAAAVIVGWLAGDSVHARRRYAEMLAEHSAERERARLAQERVRIARELHDEVAHSMSVIAVRAAAARVAGPSQPQEVSEVLSLIEAVSRSSLTELRRLLTILRTPEESTTPTLPAPGLAALPTLVGQIAAAGVAVEVRIEGEPHQLPATEDLSAYRIAQEALTNVARHSGASTATLSLRYLPTHLEIECVDPGGKRPPLSNGSQTDHGLGVRGMRERAALYGGELQAGPDGPGFRVLARLPIAQNPR